MRTYRIYTHADISVCPIQASTRHSHLDTVPCCHQQGSHPEASRIFLWNKMSSFHGPPLADTEYSSRNETEHPINNPTLYLKQQEKEQTAITKRDCIIDRILSTAKGIYHLQCHESVFSSFSPTPSQRREKINKQTADGFANMPAAFHTSLQITLREQDTWKKTEQREVT